MELLCMSLRQALKHMNELEAIFDSFLFQIRSKTQIQRDGEINRGRGQLSASTVNSSILFIPLSEAFLICVQETK